METRSNRDRGAQRDERRHPIQGTLRLRQRTNGANGHLDKGPLRSAMAALPIQAAATELAYMPAAEQLRLFRSRKLSPVDVLKAQVKQAELVEAKVKAFTFQHFEEALKAARESADRYAKGQPRPLEGVTVALKDEHGKRGWTVTRGSKLFRDEVALRHHPVTEKLLAAGAIPHAQTTVPEICCVGVTWSDLWGVTRNPWNLACTAGGSSGGSGAALAAGTTTLATGSDMGGSIRIPAGFCGVCGFKPPYGRVSLSWGSPSFLRSTDGPMARNIRDLALMQNVLSGRPHYFPAAQHSKPALPSNFGGIRGCRVAFSMDQGWAQIDPDIVENTKRALAVLENLGAIVEEVDLGLALSGGALRRFVMDALRAGLPEKYVIELEKRSDQMTTYAREFTRLAAKKLTPKRHEELSNAIAGITRVLERNIFQRGYDVLVTPSLATTRIAANHDPTTDSVSICGTSVDPYLGWVLTPLFSVCSANPVIALPTGLSENRVPTGIQIVAGPYEDAMCFRVATAYTEAAPKFFQADCFPNFDENRTAGEGGAPMLKPGG